MAHIDAAFAAPLVRPAFNGGDMQDRPIRIEVAAEIADNSDVQYTMPVGCDLPPSLVSVYQAAGAIITAGGGTYTLSDGDTIEFEVDGETITHVLDGLTAAAATDTQIRDSVDADEALAGLVTAVLVGGAVCFLPIGVRSVLRLTGGTALIELDVDTLTADNGTRTFANQALVPAGGTGWSWSYDAATRVLTVKNETGGTVSQTLILVQQ